MDVTVLFIAGARTEKASVEKARTVLDIFFRHFSDLARTGVTCSYKLTARSRGDITENLQQCATKDLVLLLSDEEADLAPETSALEPVLSDFIGAGDRDRKLFYQADRICGYMVDSTPVLLTVCPYEPATLADLLQNHLGPHLWEKAVRPALRAARAGHEPGHPRKDAAAPPVPGVRAPRSRTRSRSGQPVKQKASKRRLVRADILLRLLLVVGLLATIYFGYRFVGEWRDQVTTNEDYAQMAWIAHAPERSKSPVEILSEGQTQALIPLMHVDLAALFDYNEDLIGYIKIENTKIDYPVVQSQDNTYYLKHSFLKKPSAYGCIFLDSGAMVSAGSSSSQNLVLYGHKMKNGEMFGTLELYRDLLYYKEHPTIYFNDKYRENVWLIFAVYIINTRQDDEEGNLFDYTQRDFSDEQEFAGFIKETKRRSVLNIGVDIGPGDQILTLSTCDYSFPDARLVVVAKRVLTADEIDVDGLRIRENPHPLFPAAWYVKFGGQKPTELQMRAAADIY